MDRAFTLDEKHVPAWGSGDPYLFLCWKRAREAAWSAPPEVRLLRLQRAERLGLTYEEYTLELLERGRYLQLKDQDRIAEIKAARRNKADRVP
jgi:hypothetical protein